MVERTTKYKKIQGLPIAKLSKEYLPYTKTKNINVSLQLTDQKRLQTIFGSQDYKI